MLFILLIFSAIKLTDSWCRPTERADVVFIFEESYSMGEMVFPSEWDYQKSFLAKIVDQMYIDPNNGIRVGGVTYNNESTVRFYLDTYTTKSDIIDAILNIGTTRRESVYENDTDLVYKGLETAYDSVFLSSRGDRADAPNYYIYTTDYIFPDDDPYTTGLNIRVTGDSYIWALGVKSAVTQSALVQSVGSDGGYYTGSSFRTLNTVDHAKEFWELFRGCPLIDPSAGIYYCFSVPLLYFEDPALATSSTETCEQDEEMMFLLQDSLFEIDCCGIITAWEFYPCAPGVVQFMVWSLVSGSTYELKAIQEVHVTVADLGTSVNYTIPEENRIAIVAGDRIGWRTKSKNIISYQSCDYQKDRYCPQNTYRTKFTDEPSEYMQFDWSDHLVNSSHVEKLPNRGYTLKVYANNNTRVSFDESYYLTSAADHWPIGTRFTSFEILGQDYKENVTFSWILESPYIYLNESYKSTHVGMALQRARRPYEMMGYIAQLQVVDTCRHTSTATFSVETFNRLPIITNLPKEMSVLETQKGNEFLYKVDVYDPSVPPDPVCCTLLEPTRPKTVNFELRHNGSDYLLYTFNESVFSYHNINSYMLTVCCGDGVGTVQGIIKIDVKQMKAKKYYKPPPWFVIAMVASMIPISILVTSACVLLVQTFFFD